MQKQLTEIEMKIKSIKLDCQGMKYLINVHQNKLVHKVDYKDIKKLQYRINNIVSLDEVEEIREEFYPMV
jgi:hypothetical protein